MAERFGGKYSPGGGASSPGAAPRQPMEGRVPQRMAFRTNLLFVAPFPFAIKAFFVSPVLMAQYLIAFGALMLAAWLTREGLKAEDAYNARKIAKPPAFPRKMFASAITGLGLAIAGFAAFGIFGALIVGGLGAVLHAASFGIDPLKSKGIDAHGDFQTDRVAKVVDEAEDYLTGMRSAVQGLGDRHLTDRIDGFIATARGLCRSVEDDPRALTGARKYLGVYLLGARDATVKFVDLYKNRQDSAVRADYEALLDDLEQSFARRTEKMLLDDRSDLDIEIDVLRERLEREGVRTNEPND